MTHQDIIDQIAALRPKYEALRKADEEHLQRACGEIGHLMQAVNPLLYSSLLGAGRQCVVCGMSAERGKAGA